MPWGSRSRDVRRNVWLVHPAPADQVRVNTSIT